MLAEGFGPGFNGPLLVVAQTQSAADRAALDRLDRALTPVPGVAAVQTGPAQTRPGAAPAVEVTQVIPTTAPEAQATSNLITQLRNTVIPRYTHGTTMRVYVGDLTATFADLAAVTSAKLPWFLAAIVGFGFLLLVLGLPQPAHPGDLGGDEPAGCGGLVRRAHRVLRVGLGNQRVRPGQGGSDRGLHARDGSWRSCSACPWTTRFSWSAGWRRNGRTPVTTPSRCSSGQTETARVITAAATIMIAVFIAFVFMGQRSVAEFGIGLAVAVALDAFVLRTVLVPAVMYLSGRANWWLPRWLDRRLPHLAIEPPRGNPNHTRPNPRSFESSARSPAMTILTPARPPGRAAGPASVPAAAGAARHERPDRRIAVHPGAHLRGRVRHPPAALRVPRRAGHRDSAPASAWPSPRAYLTPGT